MRLSTFVLVLVGLSAAPAAGPVTWQDRADGGLLTVNAAAAVPDPVTLEGGEFVRLDLPGAGVTGEPGAPALPVYRRLIEVPLGAEVELVVEAGAATVLRLERPLAPRQEPVPKSGPRPGFAFDAKLYALDAWHGEVGARFVEAGTMRGHRLALVEVLPARYNPVTGTLELHEEVRVTVRWTGADLGRTRARHRRYDSPGFRGRLDGVVANAGRFDFAPPDLPVGWLVIVPDEWEPSVRPLAEWRRRKGYSVFVRTLSQVGGGQANTVRAYLQDAYDNWPIPPSQVLLVGDVDRIGYFTGQGTGSPPTDLNFAMLDGDDYLPDVDLSRASVANPDQLDSLVANIVTYEQAGGTGGTGWLNKAYFIASSDGGNHQVAERTHQYVMAKLRADGVACDSLWLYYSQGTPITEAINTGRSWVTYSGHGSTTSWADCNFSNSNVRALANTDLVPYVQTFACISGDYTYGECFSEAWIRNGRRGALSHIASTVNSYWTEDDTLERRVFDCMFDSSRHWIMGGFNRAKLWYFAQMGNTGMTRRYLEMYNLMGDGAIDVYAHEPAELAVSYPPVIPLGTYPMPVSVSAGFAPVENALVCAMAKGDTTVHAAGYTDASGQVTLIVSSLAPDSVYVTVTGHDLTPHLGACLALPSSGPYVMHLRHVVDDSAGGNNDGIINPGETINLPMWVKNWGSGAAEGVVTRLRAQDPNITLSDSVKSFGSIAAGDSAFTGAEGFGFAVATACTNRYALRFTVSTRDANDSVWETPLTLAVGAPVLDYEANRVVDPPPGGNGNAMLDPGETADLVAVLRNTGAGHAYGVTAVLRSGDARLAVIDSTGSFGDIPRDTIGENPADPFRVRADAGIPRETQVPCTLVIAVGGATYTRAFLIDVGVIRSCDPTPDGPRTPALYYAYDATDTLYSEAPTFEWLDIAGVGTRLAITSDDQTVQFNLPTAFGPFYFYGRRFSQLSVCGNGWVGPGYTTRTAYSNIS
ncbi:MAG: C25 family cysteine peptidase, partial [bacterium]